MLNISANCVKYVNCKILRPPRAYRGPFFYPHQMNIYDIGFVITESGHYRVAANSEAEAKQKLQSMFDQGEVEGKYCELYMDEGYPVTKTGFVLSRTCSAV